MAARIEDLTTPPVVGTRYDVPGVVIPKDWPRTGEEGRAARGRFLPGWWPTLGPEHEDREILEFPPWHIHIDPRFVPNSRFKPELLISPLNLSRTERDPYPPLTHERRIVRCCRTMPGWPWNAPIPYFKGHTMWKRLEDEYAGARLKSCKVCPHRGIPLSSMEPQDGVLTCPGHGLRWDAQTGEIVKRNWPGCPPTTQAGVDPSPRRDRR